MRLALTLLLLSVAVAAVPAAQPVPPAPMPAAPVLDVDALIAKAADSDPKTADEALFKLVGLGSGAVPALTQGLWAESSTTRRLCAAILVEIGADARAATPSLVRLLNDDNTAVRRAAIRALSSVGAHSAIPALKKSLKDDSADVRLAAAEALIALGADAETVIPVLTKALKAERPEEYQYAVGLLGELGSEAAPALPAIETALVEADPAFAGRIADALGRIGPEAKNLVPLLKKKVKDDQNAAFFRTSAAIALWRIARDPDAAELLREALAAKKAVRPLPHAPLLRIEPSLETIEALAKLLKSEDIDEVLLAAEVLGTRSKDTIPQLVALLKKGDERVYKLHAGLILGRIGPDAKEALEPLTALAKTKTEFGSFPAAVAVYQIDPKPENAMAIAEYLEDKDHRLHAAEALKFLRPTAKAVAIELLLASDSPDDEFRLAAAVALWRIEKNPAALKAVVRSLHSADPKMRAKAAADLGADFGADAKPALPDLVKRLFDSRASVRSVSAEALGRVGPAALDAVPALLTLLEGDEPAFVYSAACEALGRIQPADKDAVTAALKQKLEHPAPLVRAHAALALVLMGDKSGEPEAVRGLGYRTHHVRITAAEAVWRLNKDGRVVPLLVRALEESNLSGTESENERYMAARALGRIGADAKPAVPELLKLIDARDPDLATTARTALRLIDPDAAKKAGVK